MSDVRTVEERLEEAERKLRYTTQALIDLYGASVATLLLMPEAERKITDHFLSGVNESLKKILGGLDG